ncbi:MAG: hypothetical protein IPJ79_04740 [Bacteroidetes bacterium]|nr:hypothetical protein [Bacteroidota bacterium]
MRNLIIVATALTFILASCKKDNNNEPTTQLQTPSADYFKLAVGNYWVYERWKIDANGVPSNLGTLDSAYVNGDTVMNGNTYYDYRYSLALNSPNWIRDSSGILINSIGEVLATNQLSTGVFKVSYITINLDTVADVDHFMTPTQVSITVPAGSFQCIQYNGEHTFRPPFDLTLNSGANPKTMQEEYTDGIGKIRYCYYYASMPDRFENRLLRYNVQ